MTDRGAPGPREGAIRGDDAEAHEGPVMNVFRKLLILAHRYLGIALSLLAVLWFATGIVMMYAGGMPQLTPQMRRDRLANLDLSRVQLTPAEAAAEAVASTESSAPGLPARRLTGGGRVLLLTVMDRPTLEFTFSDGQLVLTWSNAASLLEASNVLGPWITNNAAASPYEVSPEPPTQFFRLQIQ